MKILKINLHSIVDVITNSSTQIYVQFNESALTTLKDLVNHFLKLTNSEYEVDDLFGFELESEALKDSRLEYIKKILQESDKRFNKMDWSTINKEAIEYYDNILLLPINDRPIWWNVEFLMEQDENLRFCETDDEWPRSDINVLCYPKKDINELKEIANIFSNLQALLSAEESER